jgi:HEAT repeat protein
MPSKQQELNRVLQELFEKSDHAVRMEILRIWSTWGTEEVVPDIRLALEEGNDFMRIQALQTISQRRFASAVPAVIALARTGKYRTEIQETLTNLGSAAEESVWPLLEGSSVETVKLALRILRRIGTGKSLPRIQKLLNDSDPFVRIEAENCSKDIKQRTN